MNAHLPDYEIRSFATDLISEQFRFYLTSDLVHVPDSVNKSSLTNRFGLASESTSHVSRYLKFLCAAVRDYFAPAYYRAFPVHVRDETNFLKYVLGFCGHLHRNFELRRDQQGGDRPYRTHTYFLVGCAFIAEFALFCFQRRCFRFSCIAKNCVLAMYYRYFRPDLCTKEDFHLMSINCMHRMRVTESSRVGNPTVVLVNCSLNGNWESFDCLVSKPVNAFLNIQVETALKPALLPEETGYVIGGYLRRNERNVPRQEPCRYCGYSCIIHLKLLLLFEFVSNE